MIIVMNNEYDEDYDDDDDDDEMLMMMMWWISCSRRLHRLPWQDTKASLVCVYDELLWLMDKVLH